MSELPFIKYFSVECLVEPVANLTVFMNLLNSSNASLSNFFFTAHPCLCCPIQQYLVLSYNLILCYIFHGLGIDVVCIYLRHDHDVYVSST